MINIPLNLELTDSHLSVVPVRKVLCENSVYIRGIQIAYSYIGLWCKF